MAVLKSIGFAAYIHIKAAIWGEMQILTSLPHTKP